MGEYTTITVKEVLLQWMCGRGYNSLMCKHAYETCTCSTKDNTLFQCGMIDINCIIIKISDEENEDA